MTSLINALHIDGSFPISSTDNQSRGFRDNFTSIRNGFVQSKIEILAEKDLLSNLYSSMASILAEIPLDDLISTRPNIANLQLFTNSITGNISTLELVNYQISANVLRPQNNTVRINSNVASLDSLYQTIARAVSPVNQSVRDITSNTSSITNAIAYIGSNISALQDANNRTTSNVNLTTSDTQAFSSNLSNLRQTIINSTLSIETSYHNIYDGLAPYTMGNIQRWNDEVYSISEALNQLAARLSEALPTYTLASTQYPSVNEGTLVTITVSADGLYDTAGIEVPYVITGISSDDITGVPLNGNFTLNSDGQGSVAFSVSNDITTEGTENLTLGIVGTASNISIQINDTSITRTYALTSTPQGSVNERTQLTIKLTTAGFDTPLGVLIPYTISGVTSSDLSGAPLSGNFTLDTNGEGTLALSISGDSTTEGPETLQLSLTGLNTSISVTLNDTSVTPTYSLSSSPASTIEEGNALVIQLTTTGYESPSGTSIPYAISGVSSSDIGGASLTGNFVLNSSGTASLTLNITNDNVSEGTETLTLTLSAPNNPSISILISDPPPPIIPSVTVTGPACFDSTTTNQFTATFSDPVTGFGASDSLAIENASYGLDVTNITQTSSTTFLLDTILGGIPYSVLETGSSTMHGAVGLTRYLTTSSTRGSPGDDSVVNILLPFPISFPTSATTSITGTNLVVGTNSFLALGSYSGSGLPPSATLPPIPAIFIGARDSGAYGIWGGSTDGDQTFIVRFEGTKQYSEDIFNRVWEVVFYAADPTRFTIRIDPTYWETVTEGQSFIKNNDTQIYPKAANLPVNKGQYITVAAGNYTLQIPSGVATSSTGHSNLASNSLVVPPCEI